MMFFFFFKQKTAYEMRISDWSSDVCSSDLKPTTRIPAFVERAHGGKHFIDRYGAFCARGFAKRRLVSHGRSIRCPGCEDGTLHFGFQIRMPRNIKGVKKTCVGLRHRSEEHTSELQSLMRISYAVFCL